MHRRHSVVQHQYSLAGAPAPLSSLNMPPSYGARWRTRARKLPVAIGWTLAVAAATFVVVVLVLVVVPSVGHLAYASALMVQEPLRWFILYDPRVELSLERDGFDVTFAAYPKDQLSSRGPNPPSIVDTYARTSLLNDTADRTTRPVAAPATIDDTDTSSLSNPPQGSLSHHLNGDTPDRRSPIYPGAAVFASPDDKLLRKPQHPHQLPPPPPPSPDQIQHGEDVVPAIFHHIVLGMEARPSWIKARDTCLDLHPGYDYMFWDDARAETFVKTEYAEYYDMWKAYKYPIQRADSLRYMVMYKYGGIFLDMDIECRRSLGPLRRFEFVAPAATPSGVSNGFFMTKAKSPFVRRLVEHLPIMDRNWFFLPYATVMFSTGCFYMSAVWAHYWDVDKMRVLTGPNSLHRLSGAVKTPLFVHLGSSSWHGNDVHFLGRMSHWFRDLPLHPFRIGMLLAFAVVIVGLLCFATCLWRVCREQAKRDLLASSGSLKYEAAVYPRHSLELPHTSAQQYAAADDDAFAYFRRSTFFTDPTGFLAARRHSPSQFRDSEEVVSLLERSTTPASEISSVEYNLRP